ncbi:oligosaccharide biosynthesis protein Alg14 like-domain-containing protein [Hypoxylon sp. FL1150]|nr:oligosaccharide biosynthesis protein Alg14 like-domain-containing protein [Hypoxylon sp. FL1150]
MAEQPQRSRVGQEIPSASNKSNPTEAVASGIELPRNNNNPIPPRIETVEKAPSPIDDNITKKPSLPASFLREPQRTVAEMEADGQRVLLTTFLEHLVPIMAILTHAIVRTFFNSVDHLNILLFGIILFFAARFPILFWLVFPTLFIIVRHCALVFSRRFPMNVGGANGLLERGAFGTFLFICGSGGHTNEMLRMLERSIRFEEIGHRRWAVGADDMLSFQKVLAFEQRLGSHFARHGIHIDTFNIVHFNRARHVHQSWFSTLATAIKSLCDVINVLMVLPTAYRPTFLFPNVIVTNGPGTGFMFLLAAHLLKIFYIVPEPYMKTIYIESWARVNTLSLSAKLVKFFGLADVFIVQHRQLDGSNFTPNMVAMPTEPHVRFPHPRDDPDMI